MKSLTDSELIAIILRSGLKGCNVVELSRKLLKDYNNLASLALLSFETLTSINGIGKDKAATLLATFEIGRRSLSQSSSIEFNTIDGPSLIVNYFMPFLKDEIQENFYVVNLNAANKIINYKKISQGIANSVLIHPREVFKLAIESNAVYVIIIHNHPSGNTAPSKDDIAITKTIEEAGKILGIKLLDHIIIAGNNYYSFMNKKNI